MSRAADLPEIWQGIDVKWSADWAPEPPAIANATRLLKALTGKGPRPALATRGYWPTVSLQWPDLSIEVEVLSGHCELYSFHNNELVGSEIPKFSATKGGIAPLLAALTANARPPRG